MNSQNKVAVCYVDGYITVKSCSLITVIYPSRYNMDARFENAVLSISL